MLDVRCFSHTIDHVGEHFNTPTLSAFVSSWVSLFGHTPKARLLWKQQTGRSVTTYSVTCWWSKWEVIKHLMVQFGNLHLFLSSGENFAPALRPKLLAVLDDPNQSRLLQLELVATVGAGEPFVSATYHLEGDGPLVFESSEITALATVQASMHNDHHPNVTTVAQHLSAGNSIAMNQMAQYALSCIQPGLQYFTTKLGHSLREPLAGFKAGRLLNAQKVAEMLPTASDVDGLGSFPFVTSTVLSDLKAELPSYVAKAS